jgi:hypothetical protein
MYLPVSSVVKGKKKKKIQTNFMKFHQKVHELHESPFNEVVVYYK